MRKTVKIKDVIIIFAIIIIAVVGIFFVYNKNSAKSIAFIQYTSGEETSTIEVKLNRPLKIKVPSNPNVVIEVRDDGYVGFISSDCPDRICIETGFLNHGGQTAACLPNKVILSVVALDGNENLPDIVL